MSKENITRHSESRSVDIEVRSLRLGEELHVYRRDVTTTIKRTGRKDEIETTSTEGFVNDLEIKKLNANREFTTLSRNKVVVIPQDWREVYSTVGGSEGDIIWQIRAPKERGLGDFRQIHAGLYDKFASGVLTKDDVFRVDDAPFPYRGWEDGRILVPALAGDYMNGHFDDAHYDLTKAIAHLKENPGVRPAVFERRYRQEDSEPKLEVHRIPYYNAEHLKSENLHFYWTPTQEEATAIVEQASQYSNGVSSKAWRAVFELDLLGLRAAGAALYHDYSGSREYDPAYEDDDEHDNGGSSLGFR